MGYYTSSSKENALISIATCSSCSYNSDTNDVFQNFRTTAVFLIIIETTSASVHSLLEVRLEGIAGGNYMIFSYVFWNSGPKPQSSIVCMSHLDEYGKMYTFVPCLV